MWRKNQESKPSVPATDASVASSNSKQETAKPELVKAEALRADDSAATGIAASGVSTKAAVVSAPSSTSGGTLASSSSRTATLSGGRQIEEQAGGESRISAGLKIRGEITGSSDMYIDGDVQGKVRVGSGRLTIGASGRVQADIEAREIVVNGAVQGNLKAADRVHLGSSGSVEGSVVTPRIGIDDGARLRGKVETSSGSGASSSDVTERAPARAMAVAQGQGE